MLLGLSLLDKASKVCGSDSELARHLGVGRSFVSGMRAGKHTITPETAAELADIAGDDAREAAIAAILERAKGTRREGVLREVLGKALAAGVAAVSVFFYSADSIYAMERSQNDPQVVKIVNNLYIVEYVDGSSIYLFALINAATAAAVHSIRKAIHIGCNPLRFFLAIRSHLSMPRLTLNLAFSM